MAHVGEQIRLLREEKGWTQPRLSVETGLAVSGISQIENGRRNPNSATLAKLAAALSVEVGDLFPKVEAPLPFEEDEQRRSPLRHHEPWRAIQGLAETWERSLNHHDLEFARLSVDEGTKEAFRAGWFVGTAEAYANAANQIALDILEAANRPTEEAYTSEELAATAEAIRRVDGIALRVEEKVRAMTGRHEDWEEALEAPRRQLLELVSKVA